MFLRRVIERMKRDDLKELRAEVSYLRTEVSDLRTEVDIKELRTELSALRTEVSDLRTEVADLKNGGVYVNEDGERVPMTQVLNEYLYGKEEKA